MQRAMKSIVLAALSSLALLAGCDLCYSPGPHSARDIVWSETDAAFLSGASPEDTYRAAISVLENRGFEILRTRPVDTYCGPLTSLPDGIIVASKSVVGKSYSHLELISPGKFRRVHETTESISTVHFTILFQEASSGGTLLVVQNWGRGEGPAVGTPLRVSDDSAFDRATEIAKTLPQELPREIRRLLAALERPAP